MRTMSLEDHLNEARRLQPINSSDSFEHLALAVQLAAGGGPSIHNARAKIIEAFEVDEDFRQTYVSSIACVIMDYDKELARDLGKAPMGVQDRQILAERILAAILG